MECLYALQSFGIPFNQIPIDDGIASKKKRKRRKQAKKNNDDSDKDNDNDSNNKIKLDNHIKWLKLCRLKESNNYHHLIIDCPNHSDIIGGRGSRSNKHPGNEVLRSIVVSKVDEYKTLKSNTKTTKLTLDIVHLLQNKYNARFLKEATDKSNGTLGYWVEVSNEEARSKVRIAFRDKIRQQQQTDRQHRQQMHDNISIRENKTSAGAIASNNTISNKKKNVTNIQHKHEQQSNNNNTSYHHQHVQQQHVEEDISSTSVFLNMSGGGSGGGSTRSCSGSGCCIGCGSGNSSDSTHSTSCGKKRQFLNK